MQSGNKPFTIQELCSVNVETGNHALCNFANMYVQKEYL